MMDDFVVGIGFGIVIMAAIFGIAEFTSNYEIVKITTDVMENK